MLVDYEEVQRRKVISRTGGSPKEAGHRRAADRPPCLVSTYAKPPRRNKGILRLSGEYSAAGIVDTDTAKDIIKHAHRHFLDSRRRNRLFGGVAVMYSFGGVAMRGKSPDLQTSHHPLGHRAFSPESLLSERITMPVLSKGNMQVLLCRRPDWGLQPGFGCGCGD